MKQKAIRIALVVLEAFISLGAVGGGIAILTGAFDQWLPIAWLQGTPFSNYTIPGLLLLIVATPTLIFDEIDAGISGRSGQIVGEKLWQLTRNHQVICVTHLPQIATFADTHYNVNKQIFDERTVTIVNELRPEQRVREIAHIMGGNVSEFTMKSAEEMLARSYLWKENFTRGV